MISVPHPQRQHPTAFQPYHQSSLPDRQTPRFAPSTSSSADIDCTSQSLDLLGLESFYSELPMTDPFFADNPTIRIQQPTTGFETSYPHRVASHQRNASSSSIGSNVSASSSSFSYSQPTYSVGNPESSPQMAAYDSKTFSSPANDGRRTFSNNLPTPTYTPVQDSFVPTFSNYTSQPTNLEPTMAAHLAMTQGLKHDATEDDIPGFSHSARQSVSSFGNSPSTPHVDDVDDSFRVSPDLTRHARPQRTMKDDFASIPVLNTNIPHVQQHQATLLSPYQQNHKLNELLQKANKNRASSPAVGRPMSPYRQNSPLAFQQAATPLRQQQDMRSFSRPTNQQNDNGSPQTISPKDALLEHTESEEDAKMPLFPDAASNEYNNQQFDVNSLANNWMETPQNSANPIQSTFTFSAGPSLDTNNAFFTGFPQPYKPASSSMPEPTPEFPAHLTRMESSVSEAPPDMSQGSVGEAKRPESTLAGSGTYSCTYHGCPGRFDSPQKLQKHKREAHRQNPPNQARATTPIGSNMSSADLLARNSQAGPHKCSRINPTTGKPCNTVFSRPYDLTRHEDTIHNCIKQKVRCAYCVEEKTFSRNDALTRHMRVVHSDVNFPGKHRRRGQD